jgi:hypothetical protein
MHERMCLRFLPAGQAIPAHCQSLVKPSTKGKFALPFSFNDVSKLKSSTYLTTMTRTDTVKCVQAPKRRCAAFDQLCSRLQREMVAAGHRPFVHQGTFFAPLKFSALAITCRRTFLLRDGATQRSKNRRGSRLLDTLRRSDVEK